MLTAILPSCKTISKFINDKSRLMAFCHKKNSLPWHKPTTTTIQVFRIYESAIDKYLNESIFASPYFQHGRPTTMFRASASNHRQHKHPSCRLCYRHALYQYAFALKSSELRTKNDLEYLETRPSTSSKKSYELKPTTRIVHRTSMHKSQTTSLLHTIHPLPTNNAVDNNFQALWSTSNYNNWTRCGQSVAISQHKFVNFFVFQTKTIIWLKQWRYHWNISWNLHPSFINSEHNKYEFWKTS